MNTLGLQTICSTLTRTLMYATLLKYNRKEGLRKWRLWHSICLQSHQGKNLKLSCLRNQLNIFAARSEKCSTPRLNSGCVCMHACVFNTTQLWCFDDHCRILVIIQAPRVFATRLCLSTVTCERPANLQGIRTRLWTVWLPKLSLSRTLFLYKISDASRFWQDSELKQKRILGSGNFRAETRDRSFGAKAWTR